MLYQMFNVNMKYLNTNIPISLFFGSAGHQHDPTCSTTFIIQIIKCGLVILLLFYNFHPPIYDLPLPKILFILCIQIKNGERLSLQNDEFVSNVPK